MRRFPTTVNCRINHGPTSFGVHNGDEINVEISEVSNFDDFTRAVEDQVNERFGTRHMDCDREFSVVDRETIREERWG